MSATISPSSTKGFLLFDASACSASATSGNCADLSFPLRVMSIALVGRDECEHAHAVVLWLERPPFAWDTSPYRRVHRLELLRELWRCHAARFLRVSELLASFCSTGSRPVAVPDSAAAGRNLLHCTTGRDRCHVIGDYVVGRCVVIAMLDEEPLRLCHPMSHRDCTSCARAPTSPAFVRRRT